MNKKVRFSERWANFNHKSAKPYENFVKCCLIAFVPCSLPHLQRKGTIKSKMMCLKTKKSRVTQT